MAVPAALVPASKRRPSKRARVPLQGTGSGKHQIVPMRRQLVVTWMECGRRGKGKGKGKQFISETLHIN